ncbi:hypothetical protein GCM10007063_21750 [Lentibacillus kapialis]|uniref:Uncharacterized protein n=1 Tax=Lentibacillus kapialis TaxID=340214 RepID=A0A917PXI5_9BACI|nr:hypothetical protein GCM10007063_21750 [Lentibacillus kapialis]
MLTARRKLVDANGGIVEYDRLPIAQICIHLRLNFSGENGMTWLFKQMLEKLSFLTSAKIVFLSFWGG